MQHIRMQVQMKVPLLMPLLLLPLLLLQLLLLPL
jgi:hypothetical protein